MLIVYTRSAAVRLPLTYNATLFQRDIIVPWHFNRGNSILIHIYGNY